MVEELVKNPMDIFTPPKQKKKAGDKASARDIPDEQVSLSLDGYKEVNELSNSKGSTTSRLEGAGE